MRQAAERLNVPESRAYELARQGKLPAIRIGKYVRVSVTSLLEYQAKLPKA
jgi:excisionase family DNA binding protein